MKNLVAMILLITAIPLITNAGVTCSATSQNKKFPRTVLEPLLVGDRSELFLRADIHLLKYSLRFDASEVSSFKGRMNLQITQVDGKSFEDDIVIAQIGAGIVLPSFSNKDITQYLDLMIIDNDSDIVSIECSYVP